MDTFDALLARLEAAVRAGDRALAIELERLIQRELLERQQRIDIIERRMRALMAELDMPRPRVERELADGIRPPGDTVNRTLHAIRMQEEGVVYPVWFGTNRMRDGRGGFGTLRSDRVTHGRADVFIPEAHRIGEVRSSLWQKIRRGDLRDDTLRLQHVDTLAHDAWLAQVRGALQRIEAGGDAPHALVFIHGFNVDFEEAAIRAAQIGVDLALPGATAFFSWPSRGNVTDYTVDEASIEASERAITDFLVDFATRCGTDRIHLIAHSMGNRGLLRALQRIAADAETRGRIRFDQVFLAAPDVDRDLFLDLARLYTQHAARATLYTSNADLPVHASSKLHDAPRAGYFAPYTIAPGVDTIAVPDFDLDLLGHSYFSQAEALLTHMRDLMLNGKATVSANRLQPAMDGGAAFWKFKP